VGRHGRLPRIRGFHAHNVAVEEVAGVSSSREDLVADALLACAGGDQAAVATLYDLTAAKVYGLTLRVLRNAAHAEEVTQEIFVEAWQRCGNFQPSRGSGLAWLMTITHRRAVDRVRSAQASTVRDATYGREELASPVPDPAEEAVASLEAHRVRRALGGLSQVQREAIELTYLDGRTHTEAADTLNVPLGTVKTRIRDGLIRLRSALGGDDHE